MTNDNESAVTRDFLREGRRVGGWLAEQRVWWCVALRSVLIIRYYLEFTSETHRATVHCRSHNHVARLVACPPIYLATCLPDEVLYEGHSAEQAA